MPDLSSLGSGSGGSSGGGVDPTYLIIAFLAVAGVILYMVFK
jgi:hypothetical protein